MQVSLKVPVEAEAVAIAREVVVRVLEVVPVPEDRIEDLRLLTSEIVTNAVRHAGLAQEDMIGVAVEVSGRRVRVEVADEGSRSIRSTFPSLPSIEWGVGAFSSSSSCRIAGALSGMTQTWSGSS